MRFKPPKLLRTLIPELLWEIPGREPAPDGRNVPGGDVFLTFDDGPAPGVTESILDELARWDAKATFFCLGRNVEAHPELYLRILAEGHRVGTHTHSHLKGWGSDAALYAADVARASEFIDSTLFRPPYGHITPREAKLLGGAYNIVMWNIISRDYNSRLTPRTCLNNVVRHVRPGDIVVFHDSKKAFRNMSYALPRVLEYLHSKGMRSKAIEI